MKKIRLAFYITMTALLSAGNVTFAQDLWQVSYFYSYSDKANHLNHQTSGAFISGANSGANSRAIVNKVNRFDSEPLSNTQRLKEILPSSSWSYLFPKSVISYQQFISLAAKRPRFCGSVGQEQPNRGGNEVVDYAHVANQFCRAQLAKAFAQLSTMTTANDVSLEIEPWRQGLMLTHQRRCQIGEGGVGYGMGDSQSCVQELPKVVDNVLLGANDRLDGRQFKPVGEHYDLFAGFLQVPTE